MKKILSLLGTITFTATVGFSVASCNIKVQPTPKIKLSSSTSTVAVDSTSTVSVTNFSEINDLIIQVQDESIATAYFDAITGRITITGILKGTTSIVISASNAAKVSITVYVENSTTELGSTKISFNLG